METIGYLLAIIMGVTLSLIGGGGSILTVPILVYFFEQEALVATAGSFLVVGTTALIGAMMSGRRGQIDLKTGLVFAIPSFVGVFLMRRIVLPAIPSEIPIVSEFMITKTTLVLASFAVLMIFASRAMIRSGRGTAKPSQTERPANARQAALNGFIVGCVTAFVGAGGGFLIVPALVILLRMPMRIAVGTSLAIIAANSLFAFFISLGTQPIDWPLLGMIAALGVTGMLVGQRFSTSVPENKLKQGFGYFVLVIGFLILLDQLLKYQK